MSENAPNKNLEDEAPQDNSMAAFSPLMKELEDALNILYIKNNASGRNKFRDKWPFVAQYLFGDVLIDYDNHGPKDREHRAELEERADERRILLKITISEVVTKSVNAGMLSFEYVGQVIDTFGAELSKFLYAENVIERVRPGLLAKIAATDHTKTASAEHVAVPSAQTPPLESFPQEDENIRVQEKEVLKNQNTFEDEIDNIKPIDTENHAPQIEQAQNHIPQESNPTATEAGDEFAIPATLESPAEQENDERSDETIEPLVADSAPPTQNTEENILPTISQAEDTPKENHDPEMHIPETLSEPEKTETPAEPPAETQTPQQPHAPKIEKGICTATFNKIAA